MATQPLQRGLRRHRMPWVRSTGTGGGCRAGPAPPRFRQRSRTGWRDEPRRQPGRLHPAPGPARQTALPPTNRRRTGRARAAAVSGRGHGVQQHTRLAQAGEHRMCTPGQHARTVRNADAHVGSRERRSGTCGDHGHHVPAGLQRADYTGQPGPPVTAPSAFSLRCKPLMVSATSTKPNLLDLGSGVRGLAWGDVP
jgi:hypothetical protein